MMQAVVLLSAMGVSMPSRGAGNVTDAQMTFDGLIGEAEAVDVPGILPDPLSEEDLEALAVPSESEDGDLAEQEVLDSSDLPVTAEDVPVPMDILQPTEFAQQLGDQDSTTEFGSSDGLMPGGGETKPIPSAFATPAVVSARDVVPVELGDDLTATNQMPVHNAKNSIFGDASEISSDKIGVESDPSKIGNAPVPRLHELPVQMENAIEVGQGTVAPSRLPTESDDASVLFTSKLSASPSETAVDPVKDNIPANTHAVPSEASMGSETIASMVAAAPNAGSAAAKPDAGLTKTGTITAKQTDGVPISVESVQTAIPFDNPEVPSTSDVPKNLAPLGPVTTNGALAEPQPLEGLPLSGDANDKQVQWTIDQSPPSALVEAEPQTAEVASDRPTDPVRPRSAIVPNVVERVAALPREVGETVIHLKPHGMGLIEVSIQQARDGGLDIVLRIQNPMVLEAMQAERQAVAQAIGGQGSAASGSLTMDLFQSGSGQRGAQGDGSGATSRSGSLPTTEETLDTAADQAVTRQIIQSDRVNIIT